MDGYDIRTGKKRSEITEQVLPSLAAWILYFVIGSVLLVLINIKVIWNFTIGEFIGTSGDVNNIVYQSALNPLFNFTDRLNQPLLMLFWAIIGLVTYFIFIGAERFLSIINSEFKQSRYLQGGIRPMQHYWRNTLLNDLLFFGYLMVWLLVFMFYINAALPWLSKMMLSGIYYHTTSYALLFKILVSLLGNMFCVYLFLQASKFLHRSWISIKS